MKKQRNRTAANINLDLKKQQIKKQKSFISESGLVIDWILSSMIIPKAWQRIETLNKKSKLYSNNVSQQINKSVIGLSNLVSDQCSGINKIEELKIKSTCFKVKLKSKQNSDSSSMFKIKIKAKRQFMDRKEISEKQPVYNYSYLPLPSSIIKNNNSFRLKKRTSIIYSLNQNTLHPDIENIAYVRNSFDSNMRIDGIKGQIDKKTRKSFKLSDNSQFFYKIKSSQTQSDHLTTLKLKQKQFADLQNDDVIRIMRQKIFLKPQFCQNLGNIQKQSQKLEEGLTLSNIPEGQHKQNANTRKKIEIKRSKETLPKKCMFLTTDYNGNLININKNDANRCYPHFIQMESEILSQSEISVIPSQNSKIKQGLHKKSMMFSKNSNINDIICASGDNKNSQEINVNYKQIKSSDFQNSFTIKRVKKVASSLHSEKRQQQKNFQDQYQQQYQQQYQYQDEDNAQTRNQLTEMKFFGQQYRPIRVSFDIFEKLKKNNWKIEQIKPKKQFPNIDDINSQQNNSHDRKSVIRRYEKQNKLKPQELSIKNLRRSQITLGNANAIQFLFNDEKKYKKTVTIHQNF